MGTFKRQLLKRLQSRCVVKIFRALLTLCDHFYTGEKGTFNPTVNVCVRLRGLSPHLIESREMSVIRDILI